LICNLPLHAPPNTSIKNMRIAHFVMLVPTALGFSLAPLEAHLRPRFRAGSHSQQQMLQQQLLQQHQRRHSSALLTDIAPPPSRTIRTLETANDSTKWLVVAAQTLAIAVRRDFIAPFIVIGSIMSAFAAHALKRVVNQQRPSGSELVDPGMPSSHALVSCFAAAAWAAHLGWARPVSALLLASAAVVCALRVACGMHSVAQVLVGGLLGAGSACAWIRAAPRPASPAATARCYALYFVGSVVFIQKKMSRWRWRDRDSFPSGPNELRGSTATSRDTGEHTYVSDTV